MMGTPRGQPSVLFAYKSGMRISRECVIRFAIGCGFEGTRRLRRFAATFRLSLPSIQYLRPTGPKFPLRRTVRNVSFLGRTVPEPPSVHIVRPAADIAGRMLVNGPL